MAPHEGRSAYTHEAEERNEKIIFLKSVLGFKIIHILFSFLCFHTTSPVAGFRFWATSSKCLISEPPGSLFFFCFNHRVPASPTLDDLCSYFGVVWINGCFFRPFIQKSQTHLIARLGGVPGMRLNLAVLMQQSPLSRRRLHSGGADAGAEPWYKTIAKLMQGRNRTSTHNCELRAGALVVSALRLPNE